MAYRTSIGLDAAIAERASQPDLAPAVSALRCLRGVSTVTAFLCAAPRGHARWQTGGAPQPKHRNALANARISDSQSCVEPDTPAAAAVRGGAISSEEPGPGPTGSGFFLPLDKSIYISETCF